MAARSLPVMPMVGAVLTALAVGLHSGDSLAQERTLHVGANVGFSTATLPEFAVAGYGGGVQLAYGINDAFNLRLHSDVGIFNLPETDSMLLWGASAGAEYLLDVIDWVPYVGLMVGPAVASFQENEPQTLLGVEVPFGLAYRVVPQLTLAAEGRYRLLFLGDDAAPTTQLWLAARVEYVWEHQ